MRIIATQAGSQTLLTTCPATEILIGGERGGGKTYGICLEFCGHLARVGKYAQALCVRDYSIDLKEVIKTGKEVFEPVGGRFKGSEQNKPYFEFDNGARFELGYLKKPEDADNYQGRQFTRIYIEEAGLIPSAEPYLKMLATLRPTGNIPPHDLKAILTANPGNVGEAWLMKTFNLEYGSGRENGVVITHEYIPKLDKTATRVFIPSDTDDNKILLERDPAYKTKLHRATSHSQVLRQQWTDGGVWGLAKDKFFDMWDEERHVCKAFPMSPNWSRFMSIDWGVAQPFCIYWWCVLGADVNVINSVGDVMSLPKGCAVAYREYYGGHPTKYNKGIEITAEEAGRRAKTMMRQNEKISCIFAGHDMFRRGGASGGFGFITPASSFNKGFGGDVAMVSADKTRIDKKGFGGWESVKSRLTGSEEKDYKPMLVFFDDCIAARKAFPVMRYDKTKPEDMVDTGEDHSPDAVRYGVTSLHPIQTDPVYPNRFDIDKHNAYMAKQTRLMFEGKGDFISKNNPTKNNNDLKYPT